MKRYFRKVSSGSPQDPWRLVAWAKTSGAVRAAVLDWLDAEVEMRRGQLGYVSTARVERLRAEIDTLHTLRGRITTTDAEPV